MAANTNLHPSLSAKAAPGDKPGVAARTKKRSGKVPAWALKLGTVVTTVSVFASGFGFASTHPYVTNAALQPAAKITTPTTLTPAVTTTTRTAVTTTKHS